MVRWSTYPVFVSGTPKPACLQPNGYRILQQNVRLMCVCSTIVFAQFCSGRLGALPDERYSRWQAWWPGFLPQRLSGKHHRLAELARVIREYRIAQQGLSKANSLRSKRNGDALINLTILLGKVLLLLHHTYIHYSRGFEAEARLKEARPKVQLQAKIDMHGWLIL